MCGIVGLVPLDGRPLQPDDAVDLQDVLAHRGPDGRGQFANAGVYLGHRRLSIIDLGGGSQPMFSADRNLCIVFNGEIYNFQTLRDELRASGHRFATASDTEVILHAYEEYGRHCVHRFRGMFAFAIWDERKKTLFLARDRLGIKPVFYTLEGGRLAFASEIKALLRLPEVYRNIDSDALHAYFVLSYIPAPMTIFRGIRKLPAGHFLTVEQGEVSIHKWWDLQFRPDHRKSERQFIEEFLHEFEQAVHLRMISDVPVGAFLSGGVDSGAVVAAMSQAAGEPVRTFSMGFGGMVGGYLDERGVARQIAERYRTRHSEHEVRPDVGSILNETIRAFDEPFADHSTIPSYYLCQMSRRHVKVALSGLGGDELFGGYERYLGFRLSTLYNFLPRAVREGVVRSLVERIPERADGHYTVNHLKRFVRSASLPPDRRYFGFLSRIGSGRYEDLFADADGFQRGLSACRNLVLQHFNADEHASDPLDRVLYCDIKTYLPEDILACTDRLSMWHSLEVRVPFVDHRLVELCATIPSHLKVRFREKKYLLRKAVRHLLPPAVFEHRKQGFVGPMSIWLQGDLRPFVTRLLDGRNLDRHGLFNPRVVGRVLEDHFARVENNDKLIWSLVMFQGWYDMYIENRTTEVAYEGADHRRMVSVAAGER